MDAVIKTNRLILRKWQEEDLDSFAKLNADPRVMEYFPSVKNFEETQKEFHHIQEHFSKVGWGFWAVSVPGESNFIGFIGLVIADFPAPFTPAVEVGWRLAFDYWNKGYATEGALASLKYGFETLNLKEIVSYTAKINLRSIKVMKKIGMHHNPKDDFDHPKLPAGHKLRRHVLYRINHQDWREKMT